jgi:hypothetical protein
MTANDRTGSRPGQGSGQHEPPRAGKSRPAPGGDLAPDRDTPRPTLARLVQSTLKLSTASTVIALPSQPISADRGRLVRLNAGACRVPAQPAAEAPALPADREVTSRGSGNGKTSQRLYSTNQSEFPSPEQAGHRGGAGEPRCDAVVAWLSSAHDIGTCLSS